MGRRTAPLVSPQVTPGAARLRNRVEVYLQYDGVREETHAAAMSDSLRRIEGAFSLVMLTPDRIFAARDPRGFRPLVMGRIPGVAAHQADTIVFASETCDFDLIGANYERDVKPGEMIVVGAEGNWLIAHDGSRYLDANCGYWCLALGCRPAQVEHAVRFRAARACRCPQTEESDHGTSRTHQQENDGRADGRGECGEERRANRAGRTVDRPEGGGDTPEEMIRCHLLPDGNRVHALENF